VSNHIDGLPRDDDDLNSMRYEQGGVVIAATEKPNGGVNVMVSHRGVTDTVVIPKASRRHYQQGFELLAVALKVWKGGSS